MNGDCSERLPQECECHQDGESGILENSSAFAQRVLEEIEDFAGTTTCVHKKNRPLCVRSLSVGTRKRSLGEKLLLFFGSLSCLIEYHRQDIRYNRCCGDADEAWHHERVVQQVFTDDGCA